MTSGLIERVSRHSRAMIESDFLLEQDRDCPLLVASYDLLSRICTHLRRSASQSTIIHDGSSIASGETTSESTNNNQTTMNIEPSSAQAHLLSLLSSTEAAGVIGALYSSIALSSPKNNATSPTQCQSGAVKNLAAKGLRLLRCVAELDLQKLQVSIYISITDRARLSLVYNV